MNANRDDIPDNGTALLDAVETLSKISELEFDQPCAIVEDHLLSYHHRRFHYQTARWFHQQDGEIAFKQVRTIFRSVLHYLCKVYSHHREAKDLERIHDSASTVMELVGEAAKQLDHFSALFKRTHHSSVTNLKEYRELQHSYREKLVPQVDERLLSHWILALSQHTPVKELMRKAEVSEETKHMYVDLESVTKDLEYELFYLKKEDGSRFFNPRLLRNMKVVSDLEHGFAAELDVDPLIDLPFWKEELFESRAKQLLRIVWPLIASFYRNAAPFKDQELPASLNKAMMALLLASRGVEGFEESKKGATGYFRDFLHYLNDAVNSEEYLGTTQAEFHKHQVTALPLAKFLHEICFGLFCKQDFPSALRSIEEELISQALVSPAPVEKQYFSPSSPLSHRLMIEWSALNKLLKSHPNGSLHSILQDLQGGNAQVFSPWKQLNLPFSLWDFSIADQPHQLLHLPFPAVQETLNRGRISEEFSAFLRLLQEKDSTEKYLMINLQDRTSWKDHLRCQLAENYADEHPECENFATLTLAIDTDFYYQLPPYDQDNHAEIFMDHFLQHLQDENTGFYFSPELQRALDGDWFKQMLQDVHKLFFEERNVLTKEKRLDFIQIAYMFIAYKALDVYHPSFWSFSCKDGIDIGASFATQIYFLTKLWTDLEISEEDYLKERSQLFLPALLMRERVLHADRFYRFISALKVCESRFHDGEQFVKQFYASLKRLYSPEFLKSKIRWKS